MRSSAQRTTDQHLDSSAVIRAIFDGWDCFHENSLGNDDPFLPNDGRQGGW